jgi:NAD(P)-dependent dehydrogenase (short-subunit alcohol dehydrogenase family)
MRLEGRTCLITGATGIAAAAARRFVGEGAAVFVVSLEAADCDALGLPHALADLRDEAATEKAFAAARTHLGRIDAVLAVAGASGRSVGDGPAHDVSLDAWDATIALNLTPAFLAAREGVRAMLAQDRSPSGSRGSIVLVSSVLAFDPAASLFATHAYAAAKAGIIGLARTMAATYAADGIRVNVLAPGLVATPMSVRAQADPASVSFARAKQPLADGFLTAADVAATALHLCSDESAQTTGQVLTVDGGWTVQGGTR